MTKRKVVSKASMKPHKTVRVRYKDYDEKIDVLIAPLIYECWRAGVNTVMSCQEVEYCQKKCVWIEFDTSEDLDYFVQLIAVNDKLRAHAAMSQNQDDPTTSWHSALYIDDFSGPGEPHMCGLVISLYFPQSDINSIVATLKEFNDEMKPEEAA
jgi:hypothetical protein